MKPNRCWSHHPWASVREKRPWPMIQKQTLDFLLDLPQLKKKWKFADSSMTNKLQCHKSWTLTLFLEHHDRANHPVPLDADAADADADAALACLNIRPMCRRAAGRNSNLSNLKLAQMPNWSKSALASLNTYWSTLLLRSYSGWILADWSNTISCLLTSLN